MSNSAMTLMLIDDEPSNIDLIKGLIPSHYKLKAAISGVKALKIIEKDPNLDLILLDVMMPEMDGYEVCRQLKANPLTVNIMVVFLSGHLANDEKQKGLALGAVDFISKPVEPDVLLNLLANLSKDIVKK